MIDNQGLKFEYSECEGVNDSDEWVLHLWQWLPNGVD